MLSYEVSLIVVESFEVQPGSELVAEISEQLTAPEVVALQETKLAPDDRAKNRLG